MNKNNIAKIGKILFGTIISFLIIAGSVFYYYFSYLPNREQQKSEQTPKATLELRESQRKLLDDCLIRAELDFTKWIRDISESIKKDGGWVSPDEYQRIRSEYRDDCYKKYPIQ